MGGMVQHMHLTPLFTKVRFGLWDEVLAEPAPPGRPAVHARDVARGARSGACRAPRDVHDAEARARGGRGAQGRSRAQDALHLRASTPRRSIVAIAHEVLSGDIARQAACVDQSRGITFAQAVALEDGLTYMEPPDWPIPVRQLQGAALLELGRAKEAEDGVSATI